MGKKFVSFGEIMLRLRSPEHERLFQSPVLEATFGGGEANVAVSLAIFGEHAQFVTALPENAVGEAAVRELRKYGVDVSAINRTKGGRVGIYFLETVEPAGEQRRVRPRGQFHRHRQAGGFRLEGDHGGCRMVPCDRHHSGPQPERRRLRACRHAGRQAAGATVSIDLNYRKKLWNYGKKAPEVMRVLAKYADVIIANEEDIQKCLGIEANSDVTSGKLDTKVYEDLASEVKKAVPQCFRRRGHIAREPQRRHNGWSARFRAGQGSIFPGATTLPISSTGSAAAIPSRPASSTA